MCCLHLFCDRSYWLLSSRMAMGTMDFLSKPKHPHISSKLWVLSSKLVLRTHSSTLITPNYAFNFKSSVMNVYLSIFVSFKYLKKLLLLATLRNNDLFASTSCLFVSMCHCNIAIEILKSTICTSGDPLSLVCLFTCLRSSWRSSPCPWFAFAMM